MSDTTTQGAEPNTKEFTALGQFMMAAADQRMDGVKMVEAMAYLVDRAQVAPQIARWPTTPEEVRAFIGSSFAALTWGSPEDQKPHEDDRYTLTAHDLLSAIRWWTMEDEPQQDARELVEQMLTALENERVRPSSARLTGLWGPARKAARAWLNTTQEKKE